MNRDEKVKELSKKLIDGVHQTFSSEHFKRYLKTVSIFHAYSPRNVELIFLQKPHATYVAGFEAWKKLGRYVRRGEAGISVFSPSKATIKREKAILDEHGKPKFDENGNPQKTQIVETRIRFFADTVFDISQTEGSPLPALCKELQGAVPQFQKIFTAIQNICPYKIVFEEMDENKKGYCACTEEKIALKLGMSDGQIVKTLIHEFAHAILHSGSNKSTEQKEIEAESIAFIVSDFLGIDTSDYSFNYVSAWSHDMSLEQIQDVLENIQNSANKIIEQIQTAMQNLEKAQEKKPLKLSERLDEAEKKSKQLNTEKEMIPNGKLLA